MTRPTPERPLVSVGLPTYNRAGTLGRAIESVLGQTYEHLELVISDNASTDATEALCREACDRDPRVRYLRQPVNRGATANFNVVAEASRGDYLALVGDDDWLDPSFVELCLQELLRRPDASLACGAIRMFRDGELVNEQPPFVVLDDAPERRVVSYYAGSGAKAAFYGLRSRAVQRRLGPMRNVRANDQLVLGELAYLGKLVAADTYFNYSLHGVGRDPRKLAVSQMLPSIQARAPLAWTAFFIVADIAWRSPIYGQLGVPRRTWLAVLSVVLYLDRRIGPRRTLGPPTRRAWGRAEVWAARRWRRARRRVRRLPRQARRRARRLGKSARRLGRSLLRGLATGARRR